MQEEFISTLEPEQRWASDRGMAKEKTYYETNGETYYALESKRISGAWIK